MAINNHYRAERDTHTKSRKTVLLDMIHTPTHAERKKALMKAYANAQKQLKENVAENNRAKIKRSKTILENIEAAIAREESRS